MKQRFAVRNLRMCEKDCLCLYVCPTGAADTENSIIDVDKCIGCGACAESCPSKAISMMPVELPAQQKKDSKVISALNSLITSKAQQEQLASVLGGRLAKALVMSNRLMAEDLSREAGYMLPQSKNARDFLTDLIGKTDDESVKANIKFLLDTVNFNE